MDLKSSLINTGPRDLSGPNASDRFVYQQTWALCHLLELHISGQDYVVIFDHHEDVSVLNSEKSPDQIHGYQIKTKDGSNFTIKNLLHREIGAGDPPTLLPSILGKLYDLKKRFPLEVGKLAIISNASVSVKLHSDGKMHYNQEKTTFDELHKDTRDQIAAAIKAETSMSEEPALSGVLEFNKAELPLKGHETHARGVLVQFLQELFPNREFSVVPLYRALLSEVAVRNNNKEKVANYEDLLRLKALSRSNFTKVLDSAGVSANRVDLSEVAQRLSTEGCPFAVLAAVRREWDTVRLDRLIEGDIPRMRLREAIKNAVAANATEARLIDLIDKVYAIVAPKLRREWGFSEIYVKTGIIIEAYER